jgi:methyl-accepting chemotaxis protein
VSDDATRPAPPLPSAAPIRRSLFAKAALLLVAVTTVVALVAGAYFSAGLASDSRRELDLRGRALLRTLERHDELRLAITLQDRAATERVLRDVLASDEDARYLAAVGADGGVLAAVAHDPGDAAETVRAELPHHALGGGEAASDARVRRFTREVRAGDADAALALPGDDAAARRSDRLVLGLDPRRVVRRAEAQIAKTVAAIAIALLAVLLLFFWALARRTARMAAFAEALAARDLSAALDDPARDELGRVAGALLVLRRGTDEVLRQLRAAAGELRSASGEVLASADAQLQVTEGQARSVERTGAVVERVRDASRTALERAEGVVALAHASDASTQEGSDAVAQAVTAIVALTDQAESMVTTVVDLVERTARIGDIMTALRDIAEQSGVLALNASIEAARAGEAGRGFAVVAGEVRSLADRSRAATAEVQKLLAEIQRAARASLTVVEESRSRAQDASGLASASGEAIRRLAAAIGESSAAATEIVDGTRAQGAEVDRIWTAMQDVVRATHEAASGVAQLRDASRAIATHADTMQRIVETYRLEER